MSCRPCRRRHEFLHSSDRKQKFTRQEISVKGKLIQNWQELSCQDKTIQMKKSRLC